MIFFKMCPFRTFLSILSIFALLGIISFVFPSEGLKLGDITLRFPSVISLFQKDEVKFNGEAPEEHIQKLLDETRERKFSAYADSLKFYEDFFKNGPTRFDLPDNNPAWFDRFFARLKAANDSGKVIHIIHYGDSQLEGDRITSTLREYLQTLFGGSGPGMLPALADIPSLAFIERSTGNLSRHRIFGPQEEMATHNRYGPMAQFSELRGSATISLKKRPKTKGFEHVGTFQTIQVFANKGNLQTKLIYASEIEDTVKTDSLPPKIVKKMQKFLANPPEVQNYGNLYVYSWNLALPTSDAKVTLNGKADIYTIVANAESGVAVDNIAMRGSSGTIFHRMDKALLSNSYQALHTDLIIMEYGGNLVPSVTANNINWVKELVEKQIRTIKETAPDADILFIGPADMSKRINGKWQSFHSLNRTIETLRQVALKNGCAYFDMHRVMGGDGAMIAWVNENPPLAGPDYIHFTRAGAAKMGELLYNSLKLHYDYYTFREAHEIDEGTLGEIHAFVDSLKNDTLVSSSDTLILTPISEISTDSLKKENKGEEK
ncbi:MAG: GDSL-type esterase/lipase family protein [Fibrobacteraceae bacterium]